MPELKLSKCPFFVMELKLSKCLFCTGAQALNVKNLLWSSSSGLIKLGQNHLGLNRNAMAEPGEVCWRRPNIIVAIKVETAVQGSVLVHTPQPAPRLHSPFSLRSIPGLIFEMHTIYCFIGPSRWRDPGRPRRPRRPRPDPEQSSHFADSSETGRECVSETDRRPWNVESKLSKTINNS